VLLCACLFGCLFKPAKKPSPSTDVRNPDNTSYVPDELVGMFDNEQLAREAAEIYGIELVSFDNGIAVFKCSSDPVGLIETGEKNGWPSLSLNYIYKAFG